MFASTLTFLAAALASTLVLADSHVHPVRRHNELSLRGEGALAKRFDNTRFTYFAVGQNACGSYDQNSDFIVALNTYQWDGGSNCYAAITIAYNGKSAHAKITDECMGCPYGAIDLSPGLMEFLVGSNYASVGEVTVAQNLLHILADTHEHSDPDIDVDLAQENFDLDFNLDHAYSDEYLDNSNEHIYLHYADNDRRLLVDLMYDASGQ
ncbi:uncharacterized protein BXZ73DRAFT_95770 [Epithele typhae]|uniref:uncharacterized protein n=1 Tax=Epithele typhae TaxID=378194 RepID=UPI0020073B7D|nr:uncharacterized protein BXZ73DRAFT_95770 [Epithele typhae]KAH9946268.1 hypothetical protein BXZ73DRAFT_95770 [Epithele typhae]